MSDRPTSIARRAAGGAAWNVGASLGTRVITMIATLVVTHYLTPDESGEVAGALIITQVCLTLSQMGLGQHLVVKPASGPKVAFHITFYTTLACALTLAAALLFRERIGPFFKIHELGRYLPWLCLMTMLDRLSNIPERILSRELRFRLIALGRASGELVYSVVSVCLAMLHKGGMALVIAGLLRTLLRAVICIAAVDLREWIRPCAIRWSTTKEIMGFGLPLSVSNIAGSLATRCDNLVISRYFDAGIMGLYNMAYNLSEMPVSQVGEQVGDVLLPSFARMSPDERRRTLGRSMAILGLIVFPLAVGLAAVSRTLVEACFNAKWSGVAPMLSVLAALSVTRPISYVVVSYLQAISRVFVASALEVVKVALLFTLMVVAGEAGLEIKAVCAVVGAAFLFHALAGLWVITHDGLPFWKTLLGIMRPLLSTIPMAAAVLGARWALAAAGLRTPSIGLVIEIVVGAAVYVGSAFVIAGDTARELVSFGRSVVAGRRGRAAAGSPTHAG